MLSCVGCVIEEVCHCFPSGGNLVNVGRRAKMAAVVNYTGRGCILEIMAGGDSLCSGRFGGVKDCCFVPHFYQFCPNVAHVLFPQEV